MTTANKITVFRMLMVPVFVILLYLDLPSAGYWALGVFILASVTDTVDGYIARHYHQVTDLGKFLDPLADKLLVISAMAIFTERGYMPGWAEEEQSSSASQAPCQTTVSVLSELAVKCGKLRAHQELSSRAEDAKCTN